MPVDIVIIDAKESGKFRWGEEVSGVRFYACSESQLQILASPVKYTSAFLGTGAGKTTVGALWLWKKLNEFRKKHPNELWRALCVSPTYPVFTSSQLKQHICATFENTVYHGIWEAQAKTYKGNNFEIICKSADNDAASLTGGQYDAIFADEIWSITNVEVFHELRRRSNIRNAPLLLVTTPNCDGWLRTELYEPFLDGNPEYYCIQGKTNENPIKSKQEHAKFLEQELKKLGPQRYARMYEGQFSALSGLVYQCFSDREAYDYPVIKTLSLLPSPAVRAFGGCDWGWQDAASVTFFVTCENDITYMVEEIYGSHIPLDDLGRRIKKLVDKWTMKWGSKYGNLLKEGFFNMMWCDASRPEAKEIIARFGIPCANKRVANVEAGIALTDQVFRCGKLKIFDCCKNVIREASSYQYDDRGQPKKYQSDHAMESTRIAISSQYYNIPLDFIPTSPLNTMEEAQTAVRLGHVSSPDEMFAKQVAEEARLQHEAMVAMMHWEPEEN